MSNSSSATTGLVWGVGGIAKKIRRSRRQAQYLIDKRKIRVKRMGPKTLLTTEAMLDEDFAAVLAEAEKPN